MCAGSEQHIIVQGPRCLTCIMGCALQLLRLAPETATVVELDASGAVTSSLEVASHLIHKGDILKVGFV